MSIELGEQTTENGERGIVNGERRMVNGSRRPGKPEVVPVEPISTEEQHLFMRINDAMTFICKDMRLPLPVVTDASLRAFGVILQYRMEKRHATQQG